MSNNYCEVEITDPERWNLSYTNKKKTYMKMHIDLWSDNDFLSLCNDRKIMFLWMLNASSTLNSPSVKIYIEPFQATFKCSVHEIKKNIYTLDSLNIIKITGFKLS